MPFISFPLNTLSWTWAIVANYLKFCLSTHTIHCQTCLHYVGCVHQLIFIFFLKHPYACSHPSLFSITVYNFVHYALSYRGLHLLLLSCSFNCIPRNVEGRYQYKIFWICSWKHHEVNRQPFDAKVHIVPLCHLSRRYRLNFVVLSKFWDYNQSLE